MKYLFVGSNDNKEHWAIRCYCGCSSWFISTEFLFQCTNCSNRVTIEEIIEENDL